MKREYCNIHIIGNPKGKKILLIHGMGFYWCKCFSSIIKELKEKYCLLIPELKGHAPNCKEHINSVYESAIEIESELKYEDIEEIDLVYGISLGAAIALEIAIRNNITLNKLILDGGQYKSIGDKKFEYAEIISKEFEKITKGNHMSSIVQQQMGYLKNNDIEVLKPLMYLGISGTSLYKAALSAYSYDIKHVNKKLNIDIAVIFGGNEIYAKESVEYIKDICSKPLIIYQYDNMGHSEVLSKCPYEICKLIDI